MSLIIALTLAAASTTAPEIIDVAVAQFTGAAIGEEGGALYPVDRRLRLKSCGVPLALEWRGEERRNVIVHCPEEGGWRIFVPVRAQAKAAASNSVDVSAAPAAVSQDVISRGDAVAIEISGQGFTVTRPAQALEDGAVGEWIRVRPISTDRRPAKVVSARVTAARTVTLTPG
ncbi:flagella basal body P-ring formation protein FlgA [Croceicoccus mobilis]|uniref:Flagella basal body P-ring formation protein FlgA SAF domain-containing protein n=1 Tax=Croceicoccus mobilis TaxID=1703339 RepID=A0A916YW94_9SPHN|nr:flagella basal body P-ring formation protein FlgA [Croceicoccus mobilis]GGD64050.1 hypothetical protein GCM10010990_11860 [Croceicoccus mobilis]